MSWLKKENVFFHLTEVAALCISSQLQNKQEMLEISTWHCLGFLGVMAAIENSTDLLIDARADFQYAFGHIPGALNIPFDTENLSEQLSQYSLQDRPLIVYYSSADCPAAERLAARLVAAGCRFVRLYPGGWNDWLAGPGW